VRLLLRADSHGSTDTGGIRIAASPDTPGRERWQWELGIAQTDLDDDSGQRRSQSVQLPRSDATAVGLVLTVDPGAVSATLELVELPEPMELSRDPGELLALVVGRGVALVESRYLLGELDTVVLAGDDPTAVRLEQASDEPVALAVVRLRHAGRGSLVWVP
jgi:hypothetical protein